MKRYLRIGIPICVLLTLLIGIAKIGLMPRGTLLDYFAPEAAFIQEWRTQLETSENPESASSALKKNKEGGEVVGRRFCERFPELFETYQNLEDDD